MRKSARSALAALFASGLLTAMAAAAGSAEAAGGPGTLDGSFGAGGKVLANLGLVDDAALQANGDIVVSGSFGLARFLPDGRLDTGFGIHGVAQAGFEGDGLAVQPDGEVIVAGGTSGGRFALARVTASGVLDASFGHGGVVTTMFPGATFGAVAGAVVVEPDGDILAGGQAQVPGTTRNQPVVVQGALALYNPGGTLVGSFGTGGIVQSAAITSDITALGTDAAGDVFVLPAHAEFSPAGHLDAKVTPAPIVAFSHGGTSTFLPGGQSLTAGGVQIGRSRTDVQVTEFNPDGSIDTAFSNPPFVFDTQNPGRESPGAITVAPDGKIVVAGASFRGTSVFGVARLNPDGSLDTSFGTGGSVTTNFQGDDIAHAVLVQPNGDIVTAGDSINNSTGAVDVALARYLG